MLHSSRINPAGACAHPNVRIRTLIPYASAQIGAEGRFVVMERPLQE